MSIIIVNWKLHVSPLSLYKYTQTHLSEFDIVTCQASTILSNTVKFGEYLGFELIAEVNPVEYRYFASGPGPKANKHSIALATPALLDCPALQ